MAPEQTEATPATPPSLGEVKERNKLILGFGRLVVKLLLPLLAVGGVGTGTYAAISQRGDKQQVSTSYEQFAERFNRTLEQLDQMRLRQAEHNEDLLKLRLALHEVNDRLRTLETPTHRPSHASKPPKLAKGGNSPTVALPASRPAVTPPASLPTVAKRWSVLDDLLAKKAAKPAPLPAFKAQRAPARFDMAAQQKK